MHSDSSSATCAASTHSAGYEANVIVVKQEELTQQPNTILARRPIRIILNQEQVRKFWPELDEANSFRSQLKRFNPVFGISTQKLIVKQGTVANPEVADTAFFAGLGYQVTPYAHLQLGAELIPRDGGGIKTQPSMGLALDLGIFGALFGVS